MEKATFGAGCFWSVEDTFRNLKGVVSTAVGYEGGVKDNPSYSEVCTGNTLHAEVLEIEFNPKIISYKDLLNVFWKIHDPTTLNRQGPDIGTQYRSVIFYHNLEQKELAEKSKKTLQKSGKYKNDIVTTIEEAMTFYRAEEYHQQYLEKRGLKSCRF
ncbi:peptide-methionine (S)-S-oxide reductase MsrA [Methanobacterium alcaliphilum]|uniref:peptide-methionine (S)-S-oxide reductase MsrA n=1 Tax=Methanobacterium alcaliphilum TaxID=392018 RepID=UPI0024A98189|nr:peptide-methionine (S)-S-oxide reductase MsrA [Methanobacterium alcaliphilum]